jgi:tetratricopeptide (TPR) repeat protein
MQGSISVESGGQDTIKSRAEVVADICYSYGYSWFERKDYNRAKELFNNTIHALKRAEKKWDSPYTRLAIIEFCQNRYKKAMEFFTKAYSLCSETVKENREANLSLALCTLGKKIAAPKVGEVYLDDPIRKLEEAINQKPEFSLGPLECHRDDAQHLSNIDDLPDDAKTLVKNFINLLEEEIKKIRSRSKSIGLLPAKSCDFFISYASEDKEFARSLYDALKKENKSVWFDEAEIKTGDSLRRKIDEGIRKCTYGIVILSPNFIRKRWPQNELDALMAKEGTTNKDVIFPVCYKLSGDELRGYSPLLAGRASMYVKSINEIPKIVSEVLNKFNSSI